MQSSNRTFISNDTDLPEGTHFKDLDNDLDYFEGTWKWQRNDSIVLFYKKKEEVYDSDYNQCEDYLVGEYKFRVGNTVI